MTGKSPSMIDAVSDYLNAHRDEMIDNLAEWVGVPSVAGVPEHEPDLPRSANWLAALLRDTGFPAVQAWQAPGALAVYAEWLAAVDLLADAMQRAWDAPVGRMGNAGGGPAELLARMTGAPVVFFGAGLPEDRWHDSDERASIRVLQAGAAAPAGFWTRLAGR